MALGTEKPSILKWGPCGCSSNEGFTASQFGEKVLLGCVTGVCMGLLFTGVRNQNLSVFTFF